MGPEWNNLWENTFQADTEHLRCHFSDITVHFAIIAMLLECLWFGLSIFWVLVLGWFLHCFYSQLDWFWVSIWLIFSHRPGNPVLVPSPLQDKKKRGDQWESNDEKFAKSKKQRDRKRVKKKEKKSRKGTPAHISWFFHSAEVFLLLTWPTLKNVCQSVTLAQVEYNARFSAVVGVVVHTVAHWAIV